MNQTDLERDVESKLENAGKDVTLQSSKEELRWEWRMTAPFPQEWPSRGSVIFYAYARAIDLLAITSGEHRGSLWARVTVDADKMHSTLTILRPDILLLNGRQGVRPLTQDEAALFSLNAYELLSKTGTEDGDRTIRAYYCLQQALGKIPEEVKPSHPEFFEWLQCGTAA